MKNLSFIFSIIVGISLLITGILPVTQSVSAEMLDLEDLEYTIIGGTVSSFASDTAMSSLIIILNTDGAGQLTITLPRAFIDSTIGDVDDEFFAISDGEQVIPEEISTTSVSRTFMISFEDGTEEIELIGTTLNISALNTPLTESEIKTTESEIKTTESVPIQSNDNADEGGGCLIATAAYGTELAPQVQFLREIRDNTVMSTSSGMSFMTGFNQLYYSFSPTIADLERENPMFQEAVRTFITPMISTLSIMTLAEDGSEGQVIGLGISVIVLNLGMYIAAPAIVVWQIRKRI